MSAKRRNLDHSVLRSGLDLLQAGAVRRRRNAAVKAGFAAGVAGLAVAAGVDAQQQRVLVAIDPHVHEVLHLPEVSPLRQSVVARARPVMDDAGLHGFFERQFVHIGEHQDFAGRASCVTQTMRPLASNFGVKTKPSSSRVLSVEGGKGHETSSALNARAPRAQRNRACSAGSVLNGPENCMVSVSAPGLRTPRIDMHMCSASIITAAPRE